LRPEGGVAVGHGRVRRGGATRGLGATVVRDEFGCGIFLADTMYKERVG
jgi:hypothetical protein